MPKRERRYEMASLTCSYHTPPPMSVSREPSEEVGGRMLSAGPAAAPVPVESASMTLVQASGLRCDE
jgi:hypothetical protein